MPDIQLPQSGPPIPVRYVILHHIGVEPEHYDLMVHLPGHEKLVTWRILTPPETWVQSAPTAERIGDHRLASLEHEGEISGGRGRVSRLASGAAQLGTQEGTHCRLFFELGLTLSLPASGS